MVFNSNNLPDDPNELKAIIVTLLESDAQKQKTLDDLVGEVSRLNVTIQKLTEMLFGKKSEKLPKDKPKEESESTETSNEEPSGATESPASPEISVPKKPRKKKKKNGGGGRMKIPDNLPVTIIEIHPPLEERTCAECQEEFKPIGKSVSKRIIFKPSTFEVEETWTFAYAGTNPCCDGKIAKPEPDVQPIDKGLASISLLAIIAIMKFADHLPLARQSSRIFKRSGLIFSQSSMCRWMRKIADLLEPLYTITPEDCKKLHNDLSGKCV